MKKSILALALALAVRRILRVQLDTAGSAVAYGVIGNGATPKESLS